MGNVVAYLIVCVVVVYVYGFVRRVEEVAQHSYGAAILFVDEHGGLVGFLYLDDGVIPLLDKDLHLCIELSHALTFGYGTYDDPEVLGLDALDELFESGTLFGRLDF